MSVKSIDPYFLNDSFLSDADRNLLLTPEGKMELAKEYIAAHRRWSKIPPDQTTAETKRIWQIYHLCRSQVSELAKELCKELEEERQKEWINSQPFVIRVILQGMDIFIQGPIPLIKGHPRKALAITATFVMVVFFCLIAKSLFPCTP